MTSVVVIPLHGSDRLMRHGVEAPIGDHQPGDDYPLDRAVFPLRMPVVKHDASPNVALLLDELDGGSEDLRDRHWLKNLMPSFVFSSRHGTSVSPRTATRSSRKEVSQDFVTGAILNRSSEHKNSRIYNWLQPFVASICDISARQPAAAIAFGAQPTHSVSRLHRRLQPHVRIWLLSGSSWTVVGEPRIVLTGLSDLPPFPKGAEWI